MMFCPRGCGTEMSQANRQGVLIDYCPRCHGVWLDKGELDKIIEMSIPKIDHLMPPPGSHPPGYQPAPQHQPPHQQQYHQPPPQHQQQYHKYDDDDYYVDKHGRRRKREHWLSDLFDFD